MDVSHQDSEFHKSPISVIKIIVKDFLNILASKRDGREKCYFLKKSKKNSIFPFCLSIQPLHPFFKALNS